MTPISWPQIIAALLGGGAVGAIITAIVTNYRARIQPVGKRVDVLPIFRAGGGLSALQAQVAITSSAGISKFDNLFIADVTIANKGNKDLEQFSFGITLGHSDRCIHLECLPPDRFHTLTPAISPTPNAPTSLIDLVAKPFNRRDTYKLKLYMVIPQNADAPQLPTLGSSMPVAFIKMPTGAEIVASMVDGTVLRLGPVRVAIFPSTW